MGLLPEFFTLLGIEIFSASSFVSALLDRDIPSPAPWLFQGAAAIGLVELFVSQGFVNTGSTDLTRFWISIFYLTLSVCSLVSLNIYVAAVAKNKPLASFFSGTLTGPAVIISGIFIFAYLGGGDVSFTPVTVAILVAPGIAMGLSRFKRHHPLSGPVGPVNNPLRSEQVQNEPMSTTPITAPEVSTETPEEAFPEAPEVFEPLDLQNILREWQESWKENEQAQ